MRPATRLGVAQSAPAAARACGGTLCAPGGGRPNCECISSKLKPAASRSATRPGSRAPEASAAGEGLGSSLGLGLGFGLGLVACTAEAGAEAIWLCRAGGCTGSSTCMMWVGALCPCAAGAGATGGSEVGARCRPCGCSDGACGFVDGKTGGSGTKRGAWRSLLTVSSARCTSVCPPCSSVSSV